MIRNSDWLAQLPARRIAPTDKPRWTEDKCLHCGKPHPVDLSTLGDGHDYDYLNSEVLVERMRVRDGRLVLPNGIQYRVLVLPTRDTIAPEVLEKIEQLVRDGAYLGLGMPRFEWFSDEDLASLKAYILAQRAALIDAQTQQ